MCLTNLPDDEGDPSRDLYALQTYHTPQDSEDDDDRTSDTDTDHGDVRTDYQYGLTDVPDDEGDLSRDLYALQT